MDTLVLQTPGQLTQHIKALRKKRGFTQAQLAGRLGIKQSRYAFIENHPDTISTAQLLDLFAALRVELLLRLKGSEAPARTQRGGEDW